ncbi:MAG: thioredoxin family protein [Halobacteriaceae archaeon]
MSNPSTPAADGATPERPVRLGSAAALDRFVAAHDRALVEFYTEGCGICASMEPILGLVARSGEAAVALLNPRDDPGLIDRFTVRSVPLLVVFQDGDPVRRHADGFLDVDGVLSLVG